MKLTELAQEWEKGQADAYAKAKAEADKREAAQKEYRSRLTLSVLEVISEKANVDPEDLPYPETSYKNYWSTDFVDDCTFTFTFPGAERVPVSIKIDFSREVNSDGLQGIKSISNWMVVTGRHGSYETCATLGEAYAEAKTLHAEREASAKAYEAEEAEKEAQSIAREAARNTEKERREQLFKTVMADDVMGKVVALVAEIVRDRAAYQDRLDDWENSYEARCESESRTISRLTKERDEAQSRADTEERQRRDAEDDLDRRKRQ